MVEHLKVQASSSNTWWLVVTKPYALSSRWFGVSPFFLTHFTSHGPQPPSWPLQSWGVFWATRQSASLCPQNILLSDIRELRKRWPGIWAPKLATLCSKCSRDVTKPVLQWVSRVCFKNDSGYCILSACGTSQFGLFWHNCQSSEVTRYGAQCFGQTSLFAQDGHLGATGQKCLLDVQLRYMNQPRVLERTGTERPCFAVFFDHQPSGQSLHAALFAWPQTAFTRSINLL